MFASPVRGDIQCKDIYNASRRDARNLTASNRQVLHAVFPERLPQPYPVRKRLNGCIISHGKYDATSSHRTL